MAGEGTESDRETIKAFGRRLSDAMRSRRVSGVELARRVDVSTNTVSAWAKGRKAPDYKHLIRIIQALGAEPAELLSDNPPRISPSDRLIVRLAGLELTDRARDLSAIGGSVVTTLEQVDRRAEEIPDDAGGD